MLMAGPGWMRSQAWKAMPTGTKHTILPPYPTLLNQDRLSQQLPQPPGTLPRPAPASASPDSLQIGQWVSLASQASMHSLQKLRAGNRCVCTRIRFAPECTRVEMYELGLPQKYHTMYVSSSWQTVRNTCSTRTHSWCTRGSQHTKDRSPDPPPGQRSPVHARQELDGGAGLELVAAYHAHLAVCAAIRIYCWRSAPCCSCGCCCCCFSPCLVGADLVIDAAACVILPRRQCKLVRRQV